MTETLSDLLRFQRNFLAQPQDVQLHISHVEFHISHVEFHISHEELHISHVKFTTVNNIIDSAFCGR